MKRIISIALSFILVFTLYQLAFAAGNTLTWTGEGSNDYWNTLENRNPAQIPAAEDTAVIPETKTAAVTANTTVILDCSGEVLVEAGGHLSLANTSYLRGGKLGQRGGGTPGKITIASGALQWSGGSIEGDGTFTVNSGTQLNIGTSSDVALSRPLVNNGQITINSGTLILTGGSGAILEGGGGTGTFAVSDGSYLELMQGGYSIGGDFVNGGNLSIWETSSALFKAGYRQESTGTLSLKVWELDNFNNLNVTGQAELGGVLEVDLINNYVPQPGDTFEIMSCGLRTGEFSSIISNTDGIAFVPTYTDTGLTLTVSNAPALTQPGQLYTWGGNYYGQLGDGYVENRHTPLLIGTDDDWTAISAGGSHTVALKSDGSLWVWGWNNKGQLGDGTTENRTDPVRIGSGNDWAAAEAGEDYTVALKTDGSLWAWGNNAIGQLGDGTVEIRKVPTLIDDESTWTAVSAGVNHTVALQENGSLWAWGSNYYGQLGNGNTEDYETVPTLISNEEWEVVFAGASYTVAMKTDSSLWTWGKNIQGQLGDGTTENKSVPTQISPGILWLAAAAGDNHVVGIKADGSLWAWGGNEYGELGNGSSDGVVDAPAHPVPAQIGTDTDWFSVTVGYRHNAALKTDGSLWLWGHNGTGQLGDGTSGYNEVFPQRLDGVGTWLAVACGDAHTAVLLDAGSTVPDAPQNFTTAHGDGQVVLSWNAPASNGGSVVTKYEVSKDNGANWTDVGLNISHTFTGLTNGKEYTFKVRAVNSAGNGAEASILATPVPASTHTVNFYSNGSLYDGKTVTSGSAIGTNWPGNPTRSGYSFGGWFSGQNGAGTRYTSSTIINADVDLYANWTYNGGGSSGSESSTPATPIYKADVKTENGTEMTITMAINQDAGIASLGSDPWIQRIQGRTIITIPSVPGVSTYLAGVAVARLSTTDVQGTLTFNTSAGNVTVPSNMLTGLGAINGNKAEITIGQGDKSNLQENVKKAIGNRPLIQLTLSIDGRQINWSNPNALVTVSIPYAPTALELANPENIVVWYIDGSGNVTNIPNGRYDPATGMVTFTTTHFSDYAVAYNKVSFNDVIVGMWHHKAVSFIAARGVTGGTGNGNYSPEAKLTRGQFIVMLMKAYGIAPDADPKDNFADAGATYYTGYLATAKRLSISNGVGNNMFAPDKEITRQEMFTLLYNALKAIGSLPEGTAGKPLSAFADVGNIASWAKEAMTLLVKTGTIGGNAGKLDPLSTTTRAEMAQVLYNLLSK